MYPVYIIILIIIVMGLFGGIINYYLAIPTDKSEENVSEKNDSNLWIKSLSMGIAAAILVPLFLNTISSSILIDIIADKDAVKNYFIFSGFCLIAAIFSKRFISDLYDKVIKVGKEATEAKKVAVKAQEDAADAKATASGLEDDLTEPQETIESSAFKATLFNENPDTKALLDAFTGSTYTYRTLKGLAIDTKLSEQKVSDILKELELQGRAKFKINRNGNQIWKIIYR